MLIPPPGAPEARPCPSSFCPYPVNGTETIETTLKTIKLGSDL